MVSAVATAPTRDDVRTLVATVTDPEIPVLTIEDIGILRDITVTDGHVVITITPTYSGCPAMDAIRDDVGTALRNGGIDDFEVRMVHAPAWTTDWMTEAGKRKLEAYGIAPPAPVTTGASLPDTVLCPRCRSDATSVVSEFASTACKALLVCSSCGEPFDAFKSL